MPSEDSTAFSSKEKKLYELLVRQDDTGQLPIMLVGIVRVLKDDANPMRFHQASSTIRALADSILKLKGKPIDTGDQYLQATEIAGLEDQFVTILAKTLLKIQDADDKKQTDEMARRQFEITKNILLNGTQTRIDKLVGLLGGKNKLRIVSQILQEQAKESAKLYNYFTSSLHRCEGTADEFMPKWERFQDFLIVVASEFFDIAKEIEPFLTTTEIPDGRSK